MKKIILTFIGALMIPASLALEQSAGEAKTLVGIIGGINFQNLNGKDSDGDKLENDLLVGYHAGINLQIPLAPEFYFQPGLLFSAKGAKNTSGSVTSTYKLSYIELPLNLVYKGMLGDGYILFGFGPYLGYAVGGSAKFASGSVEVNRDIEFINVVESNDDPFSPYFKSMDIGGNILFGYEMAGGLFFQLNSQLGMVKINPEDRRITDDKTSVKNTGFGLSAGYRF